MSPVDAFNRAKLVGFIINQYPAFPRLSERQVPSCLFAGRHTQLGERVEIQPPLSETDPTVVVGPHFTSDSARSIKSSVS